MFMLCPQCKRNKRLCHFSKVERIKPSPLCNECCNKNKPEISIVCPQCKTDKELCHFSKVERKKPNPLCNTCCNRNSEIVCSICLEVLQRSCFSKEEYDKVPEARCIACCAPPFCNDYNSGDENTGDYLGHGVWDTPSGMQEGPYNF